MSRHFYRGMLLLSAGLLWVGCQSGGSGSSEADQAAFVSDARAASNRLELSLKRELTNALKDGSEAAAIRICRERATGVGVRVSQESELRVGRVAVPGRNRNPDNAPSPAQAAALARFEADPALVDTVIVEEGKSTYMRPIRIGVALCLRCHGSEADIASSVRAALADAYPQDRGVDFAMGDLRGAFVVRE